MPMPVLLGDWQVLEEQALKLAVWHRVLPVCQAHYLRHPVRATKEQVVYLHLALCMQ